MARLTVLLLSLWAVVIYEVVSIDINICWRDGEGRGVGTIPNVCKEGHEKNGALCYPKCQDGYYGVGPLCWQRCPSDYHDGGVFCWKGGKSFAKKTYGRTAGRVPGCAENQEEELALCYKNCSDIRPGYIGMGPTCWQQAPDADYPVECKVILPLPVPVPLPTFAYGKKDIDCTLLTESLSQTANATKQCGILIVSQGFPGLEKCIVAMAKLIPELATTKKCPP